MPDIPRKQSLAALVLERLREGILRGEWEGALPAERPLGETLQVSRSTLRLALAQLKKEGWIAVEGKRHVIQRRPATSRSGILKTRRVVFLSPLPLERLPSLVLFVYAELGRKLSALGATIQLESSPAFSHRRVDRSLEKIASDTDADAWVLYRSPPAVQEHFESRGLAAVLLGNAAAGVELPALRVDYPAALRHCLGSLRRKGHRNDEIMLALPDQQLAGTIELERGFRDEVGDGPRQRILKHREDYSDIESRLEQTLRGGFVPTAIIAFRPSAAARIHGLLPHRLGIAVPGQVSLACLDDAPFMHQLVPRIDRYHVDTDRLVRFVFNGLSRQLSSGIVRGWDHRPFVPEYVPGETLALPRSSNRR